MRVKSSGTIVPLEKKPKAKCRKWQLRVSVGFDKVSKKYKTKTKRITGTYSDAQRALREFVDEIEAGDCISREKYTLDEYIAEYMGLRRSSGDFAHGTLRKNDDHFKCLSRHLGNFDLCDITPLMIEKAYAALRSGDSPSGRQLSGTYAACIHTSLYGLFAHAEKHGLVDANPCEKAARPTPDTPSKKAMKHKDMSLFVKSLDPRDRNELALILCATMGIRRGEVLGLSWGDVDFGDMTVTIAHSYDDGGNLRPTKTKAGLRMLPMPEIAFDALRVGKAAQKAEMDSKRAKPGFSKLVPDQSTETPVISDEFGNRMLPHSLSTWWRRNRASYGLDGWTIHELRHSYLSALAMSGVHPKVMQELAGHASAKTTMDIYSHVNMDAKKDAAILFEGWIG